MRRNSKVNPKLSKIVARQNYRDRQIDKWWKWSWEQRRRVKYNNTVGDDVIFSQSGHDCPILPHPHCNKIFKIVTI